MELTIATPVFKYFPVPMLQRFNTIKTNDLFLSIAIAGIGISTEISWRCCLFIDTLCRLLATIFALFQRQTIFCKQYKVKL